MTLTPKQEAFCLAYIETGNASEAYRRAYDVGEATKPETVNRKAKELLDNGKIAARCLGLRDVAVQRLALTVEDLVAELDEARQIALAAAKPQSAAAVSATMGKAKLLGLVVDKQETSTTLRMVPVNETDERI